MIIYSCARDRAFGPAVRVRLPGKGLIFEYGGVFLIIIQYNVMLFFVVVVACGARILSMSH